MWASDRPKVKPELFVGDCNAATGWRIAIAISTLQDSVTNASIEVESSFCNILLSSNLTFVEGFGHFPPSTVICPTLKSMEPDIYAS